MKYDRRNHIFIAVLKRTLWPFFRHYFRIQVEGKIPTEKSLMISNHNIGALIESHSILFLVNAKSDKSVFGFTHPSIFKVPVMKQYFDFLYRSSR